MITDRILTYTAWVACLALAVALFFTHGSLQTQKLMYSRLETRVETERRQAAQAHAQALDKLRADQNTINDNYQGALNDARIRETATRSALAAVRTESDGLREQSMSAARRLADFATPDAAVREYATAVNGLFNQCQRDYQDMAGKAHGHADDVRTLIAAWPTNPGK